MCAKEKEEERGREKRKLFTPVPFFCPDAITKKKEEKKKNYER